MVFLLSAPRSGSTLLRLMLAGHPKLFCPPELALLGSADMRSWAGQQLGLFEQDGLTRALMELRGLEAAEARDHVARLGDRAESVQQVYASLQEACGERLLVDKSPAYALDRRVLDRAEAMFESPRYVLLTRHPHAVIDSFVRHRMEKLLVPDRVVDPWRFAEQVWLAANRNLLQLAESLPDRCHRLRYEDLVRDPESCLRAVAEFLDLDFDAALLEPYAPGRMIDGPGDPDIFRHDRIEAGLAGAWRRASLPVGLLAETGELAERLGYEVAPRSKEQDARSPDAVDAAAAARLLERVDTLSDDEVEAALEALLAEREPGS